MELSGFERFRHFLENGLGSLGRMGGLGDGAAHDQVAGAQAQGFGGRGDALLVANRGSCGADAGDYQHALGAGERAQRGHLLRRADEAAHPGLEAHAGQQFHLFGG